MKQFISKLRTGIIILMLVGFWGISVSGVNHCLSDRPTACSGLSESDGGEKSFPPGHPTRMEPENVIRGANRIGWRGKKFSAGPSESDGGEKSFPRVYPNPMETRKTSEALSMDDGINTVGAILILIYNRQLRLSWRYNVNLRRKWYTNL